MSVRRGVALEKSPGGRADLSIEIPPVNVLGVADLEEIARSNQGVVGARAQHEEPVGDAFGEAHRDRRRRGRVR